MKNSLFFSPSIELSEFVKSFKSCCVIATLILNLFLS